MPRRITQSKLARNGLTLILASISVVIPMQSANAQHMAISPQYDKAGLFHVGVAPVKKDQLWGLIDRKGRWIVEPQYYFIRKGADGRFGFQSNDTTLWGVMSASGRIIIKAQYSDFKDFSDGVAAVKWDNDWFYVDTAGKRESNHSFFEAGKRTSGVSVVQDLDDEGKKLEWKVFSANNGQFGIWTIKSIKNDFAVKYQPFSEGLSRAKFENGYFYVNDGGRPEFNGYIFEQGRDGSEGLFAVKPQKKPWIYLDVEGHIKIGNGYTSARKFSEGVAAVSKEGKWGYIDKSGDTVLNFQFDRAYSMSGGFSLVKAKGKFGFVKKSADGSVSMFVKPQFDDAFRVSENLAPVMLKGKWGYYSLGDYDGQIVRPIEILEPN